MPDHRPKGLAEQIRPKCSVVYFPVEVPHSVGVLHLDQKEDLEVVTEGQCDETLDLNISTPPIESLNLSGSMDDSVHTLQSFNLERKGDGLVCDRWSLPADSKSTTHTVKASYYAEAHVPKCLGAESENDSISGRQCSETQRAQGDDTTLTQPAFSRHLCYRSDKPMASLTADHTADPLHILWPHRW